MPVMTSRAHGLHKPKSKIRLRLGFTDASPKAPSPAVPSRADGHSAVVQMHSLTSTTASSHLSLTSHTSTSTANAPTESLGASTNTTSTGVSRWSRGDSRDAFALDISPSTASEHPPNPAFDTISYATASPQSVAFGNRIESASAIDLHEHYDSLFEQDADTSSSPSTPPSIRGNESHHIANDPTISLTHPGLASAAAAADDIFYITDEQLSERFSFHKEIGFGNWGSVWVAKPRRFTTKDGKDALAMKLGNRAAAGGGSGAGGRVAVKLVHREKSSTTAARVRALWGEMKIIRMLRHEPHPSVITFEAFIITPAYAMVVMPYLSHLIPVRLPPHRATPYFRQLASAVGYLHERGITHNDIKPANVLISYSDVPVIVDFGFANKWDVGGRGSFLSTISWGTPEYLDPQRARGMPHDERASDVWSLGITMFEILIGRTPFEYDEEEEFATPEELLVYYERSSRGEWVGEWSMPHDLQHLLRAMICPDPAYRISAMQAYHHPSLQPRSPEVIITPHFVRAAASMDFEDHPIPLPAPTHREDQRNAHDKKKKHKKRNNDKDTRVSSRAATPALGESIKQHTSVPFKAAVDHNGKAGADRTPSPKKAVIRKSKDNLLAKPSVRDQEDTTPTKVVKPAQPLRIKELSALGEKTVMPRVSGSEAKTLSRRTSVNSLGTAVASQGHPTHRDSAISVTSTSTIPAKSKEEAVLKTMRSLEGTRRIERVKSRDVLGAIKRPAPSPPRPRSLDTQVENDLRKAKDDQRRSLGVERQLADLREESPAKKNSIPDAVRESAKERGPASPPKKSPAKGVRTPSIASPPRPRVNTRPTEIVRDGRPFPAGEPSSPLTELRERILTMDKDNLDRFRKVSGDLIDGELSIGPATKTGQDHLTLSHTKSIEALDQEARRDKFAQWVKDVERMVEDARQALAEGREVPLPAVTLPEGLTLPGLKVIAPQTGLSSPGTAQEVQGSSEKSPHRRFGLTPPKGSAVPAHLRTSSTQVEPATPPKWMTEQQAEERIRLANEAAAQRPKQGAEVDGHDAKEKNHGSTGRMDMAATKKGAKKDRPTVSQVLKLFGSEKDKTSQRTFSPEPIGTVPLKSPGPTLRAAPSTPALRSSTLRHSKILGRKSESNLRNFNTMPTLAALMAESGEKQISPRRAVYEDLLESEPGVIRQGDGWTSWSSGSSKPVAKTSSMASLREKALSFLRDDNRESRDLRQLQSENQRDSMRDSRDLTTAGRAERHITDLAREVDQQGDRLRRGSRSDLRDTGRPGTPGANAVLRGVAAGEKRGIFGRLKGLVGRKGMERVDETQ